MSSLWSTHDKLICTRDTWELQDEQAQLAKELKIEPSTSKFMLGLLIDDCKKELNNATNPNNLTSEQQKEMTAKKDRLGKLERYLDNERTLSDVSHANHDCPTHVSSKL